MARRVMMLIAPLLGLCPLTARGEFALKEDDRVVFFGDTLAYWRTRGFSEYVETFVRVRYPQLKTRFFNAGLRNETTADGLRRLERDLEPISPTVVVVAFGLYDPEQKALNESKLSEFRRNYLQIIEGIKKLGARIVLVTPPRPVVDRLRRLPAVDYAEVIGRYAQAIRETAAEHKVPVVDFFESTSRLYRTAQDDEQTRRQREELLPPRLAHAALAAELLELWQAEPLEVRIELDWNSDTVACSAGTAEILRRSERELSVKFAGVPLPWGLPAIRPRDLADGSWPGARLCRTILTLENVPAEGIELVLAGRGVPLDSDQLQQGMNIAWWEPIQSHNPALRELVGMIGKHKFRFDQWQRMRHRRPKEPELEEAFESHLETMRLYEEGTAKILFRLPKTFDVVLSFRIPDQEATVPTTQEAEREN